MKQRVKSLKHWQMQIKKIISYLKQTITLRYKKKTDLPKPSTYKYYQSIDSLPFWNYEKTYTTDDLRYLIILDYYDQLPDIKVNPDYWSNISIQAFEVDKSQKSKNYINELSYILRLRNEYNQIVDSCYALSFPSYLKEESKKELIAIIEKYVQKNKINYKFNQLTETEYFKSICEADNYAKKDLAQLIGIKNDAFTKKYKLENTEKVDLYNNFRAIQKWLGIQLNPRTYTTRQFMTDNITMCNEQSKK